MILVDANLILYAEDSLSPFHRQAQQWWDQQLSGTGPVGLCWPVLTAFLRIATNVRLHERPLTTDEAAAKVQSWLDQPCVHLLEAGPAHWQILKSILLEIRVAGNLVSDAHLAALAIGYGAELCSTDNDFAMFKGLRWRNPLRLQ
jgi:toxin-antitoxin system PIN domain toxin